MSEWRWVRDFEGVYQVSDQGQVRRVDYGTTSKRSVLKPIVDQGKLTSYCRVHLFRNGKRLDRKVHQLVAEAFLGVAPPGHIPNHKDGDGLNNSLGNLEYVTQQENQRHASRVLGRRRKLSDAEVGKILSCRAQTPPVPLRVLSEQYGVDHRTISRISRGETAYSVGVGK